MRITTKNYWRFENKGTASDTETGSGTYVEMARNLALWMQRVTMNNRIVIEVDRKPLHASQDESLAELDALFDSLANSEESNDG